MDAESHVRAESRLSSLEVGRAVAAILVVLFHFYSMCAKYYGSPPIIGVPFRGGHAGVEYFFVLSGFIIYYVHRNDIGKRDRIAQFEIKRIIRIVPMFWLVVSAMLLSFWLHPGWGAEKDLNFVKIFKDYLFIPREGELILPPAWTLEREVLFYLIFSLCIFAPRIGIASFALWMVAILYENLQFLIGNSEPSQPLWFMFGIHNLGFGVGVFCAYSFLKMQKSAFKHKFLLFAGVALLLLNMAIESYADVVFGEIATLPQEIIKSFFYTVSFGLIVYGCVTLEKTSGWVPRRFLALLGASSYLIYLIHEPVASAVLKILASNSLRAFANANVAYIVTALLVIAVAMLAHLTVEKPITRYLRKKWIKKDSRSFYEVGQNIQAGDGLTQGNQET